MQVMRKKAKFKIKHIDFAIKYSRYSLCNLTLLSEHNAITSERAGTFHLKARLRERLIACWGLDIGDYCSLLCHMKAVSPCPLKNALESYPFPQLLNESSIAFKRLPFIVLPVLI